MKLKNYLTEEIFNSNGWTNKKPTKDGFYFVINLNEYSKKLLESEPFIVKVHNNCKTVDNSLSLDVFMGNDLVQGCPRLWFGPIKLPKFTDKEMAYNVLKDFKTNNPERSYSEKIYNIKEYKL